MAVFAALIICPLIGKLLFISYRNKKRACLWQRNWPLTLPYTVPSSIQLILRPRSLVYIAVPLKLSSRSQYSSNFALLINILLSTDGYLPVVIMHGILDDYTSMNELVEFIKEAHPGTDVYNIDAFNDLVLRFTEKWRQCCVYNNMHISTIGKFHKRVGSGKRCSEKGCSNPYQCN